ncbi:MAG: hypothetical protein H7Y38_04970, partial [Armatimonadetes bacterium]|nr:hypothetical protein [Armatimonadota bacterium]
MSEHGSDAAPMKPHGILFSQIGYDAGDPLRVVLRGDFSFTALDESAFFLRREESNETVATGKLRHVQGVWHTDWWVAEITDCPPGVYRLDVEDADENFIAHTDSLTVAPNHLWLETWQYVGVHQGERRRIFARGGVGWFDAGMEWMEANSQTAYINGFLDILEYANGAITDAERGRVAAQVVNGCDYLAVLQDMATELPGQAGGIVHQSWKYADVVLASDTMKAAVCWARAARLLPDTLAEKRTAYRTRAANAMDFL